MQTFFRILITTLTVVCQLISHRQEMTASTWGEFVFIFTMPIHSFTVLLFQEWVCMANLARNMCKLANARLLCLYKILLVPASSIFARDKGDIKLD